MGVFVKLFITLTQIIICNLEYFSKQGDCVVQEAVLMILRRVTSTST